MPWGLKRYYGTGSEHFITWSCYQRKPLLDSERARDLLLTALELMRERYRFAVVGYVVMPEHVHILISEPQVGNPSTVVQAVKLGFTRRWSVRGGFSDELWQAKSPLLAQKTREKWGTRFSGHFWQRRFYDFNVWSQRKELEKLIYMHQNPVVRGLVLKPEDWRWSSYRFYAYGEAGPVRINDWRWWEEKIRKKAG